MTARLFFVMMQFVAAPASANIYYTTAERYGLDPILVQAIVKSESGGHAWVMNVDGEPHYFDSKQQLLVAYRDIQQRPFLVKAYRDGRWGRYWFADIESASASFMAARAQEKSAGVSPNFYSQLRRVDPLNTDFGPMQVNWKTHRHLVGNSIEKLLVPEFNLDYGCRFLKSLIVKHGFWEGVARYHSSTEWRQQQYQRRIYRAYLEIRETTLRNQRLAMRSQTNRAGGNISASAMVGR